MGALRRSVSACMRVCADMLVLTSLEYGVADAEITVPSAENQRPPSTVLAFKTGAGQNIPYVCMLRLVLGNLHL